MYIDRPMNQNQYVSKCYDIVLKKVQKSKKSLRNLFNFVVEPSKLRASILFGFSDQTFLFTGKHERTEDYDYIYGVMHAT